MQPKEVLLVDLLIQRFNERRDERRETFSGYGQQRGSVRDLQRFADITAYMREKNVLSVADLDRRIEEISVAAQPTRDQIKAVTAKINTLRKFLEYGDRRDKLSPVHDQYLKIHWKGRKEKFQKEHKEELDAWSQADRYLRKYLPDQPYNADAVNTELSSLNAQLDELNARLEPYQEETRMLKDIKYLVKDLIPELEPERENLTQERKEWKNMTVKERLAAASRESAAENAERQRQQPQRKQKNKEWER